MENPEYWTTGFLTVGICDKPSVGPSGHELSSTRTQDMVHLFTSSAYHEPWFDRLVSIPPISVPTVIPGGRKALPNASPKHHDAHSILRCVVAL